ncbi:uncharacterized protein LOC143085682 [Mytilus galloprovincialis]|uniref:uncharacterized protein LOC143085682 n=1 Tax=Mytilus galloprovincialis TaxID=29158 RepID=UPI003F7B4C40
MICFGMNRLLLIALLPIYGKVYGTKISWQLLTEPIYFGQDVVMSCYRPYFKGDMYLAWLNKTAGYIARGNISSNETKYVVKIYYTEAGMNYTLTIKSFDSDDVNTTYKCYMGFESYMADLIKINTTFLYSQRSGDITFVKRSEKYEMIPVAIWQAYPKPVCNIFVGNSKIKERYESTFERVSIFYKVTLSFSYGTLSKYCYESLLITCDVGTTAFNYTVPIQCEETKEPPHSKGELLFLLFLIPGITVLLLVLFYARKKMSVVSLREDEHNQENDPCFQIVPTNETAHVNISLLNNSNQEQTCS